MNQQLKNPPTPHHVINYNNTPESWTARGTINPSSVKEVVTCMENTVQDWPQNLMPSLTTSWYFPPSIRFISPHSMNTMGKEEHGPRLFSWAVWHSCRMGVRNEEQTRGRIGPQLRLGNLRVGELHFCPLCTALDQASSLSRKLAYVPGPTFGFVKLLASSGSHCTKWADEQHWQAGFESRLVTDLPLPFIPTLIGLRAFDLVSSRVWWEAATNTEHNGERDRHYWLHDKKSIKTISTP